MKFWYKKMRPSDKHSCLLPRGTTSQDPVSNTNMLRSVYSALFLACVAYTAQVHARLASALRSCACDTPGCTRQRASGFRSHSPPPPPHPCCRIRVTNYAARPPRAREGIMRAHIWSSSVACVVCATQPCCALAPRCSSPRPRPDRT